MNNDFYTLYRNYLEKTNQDTSAAASLVLADVLQRSLDTKAAGGSQTGSARSLTVKQIAERFQVKDQQVLGWIKAGDLPATNIAAAGKVRPSWRISPAQLTAFEGRRASGLPVAAESPPPRKAKRRRHPLPPLKTRHSQTRQPQT